MVRADPDAPLGDTLLHVPRSLRVFYLIVWSAVLILGLLAPSPFALISLVLLIVPSMFLRMARAIYRRSPVSNEDGLVRGEDITEERDGVLVPVIKGGAKSS